MEAVFDSPYCFLISQESSSCEIKTLREDAHSVLRKYGR